MAPRTIKGKNFPQESLIFFNEEGYCAQTTQAILMFDSLFSIHATRQEAEAEALETLLEAYERAVIQRHRFTIAISGGSTPYTFYRKWLQDGRFQWGKISLFWSDERLVPHDHSDSNFGEFMRLARCENRIFSQAIPLYEQRLGVENSLARVRAHVPSKLDYIILGVGEDGHTASLFPRSVLASSGQETPPMSEEPWQDPSPSNYCDHYRVFPEGKEPFERLSLTMAMLLRARERAIYVYGEKKASVMHQLTQEKHVLPAEALLRARTETHWFLDAGAAQYLGSALPKNPLLPTNSLERSSHA